MRGDGLSHATTALLRAVRGKLAGFDGFALEEIRSRGWASATFTGARHHLAIRLDGEGAGAAAERFLGRLEATDFELRGHILADISLISEERRPGCAKIRLEALTVEEG
jgi:hypothetical protein